MYEKYQFLTFARDGKRLTVTLDSPPANTAHPQLHDELSHVFYDIERDPECAVVVLTGAGRMFSAGGDFQMMYDATKDPRKLAANCARAPHVINSMIELSKPLICRMNGHAMGFGATLALMCDVVVAAETAKIADSHVMVGLSAGDGGAIIWPLLVGFATARFHLLTGEPVTAVQAAAMGLIHKAVPTDQLDAEVDLLVKRLLGLPAMAVGHTKRSINLLLRQLAGSLPEAHVGLEHLTLTSLDHQEACIAAIEKRKPEFRGA